MTARTPIAGMAVIALGVAFFIPVETGVDQIMFGLSAGFLGAIAITGAVK